MRFPWILVFFLALQTGISQSVASGTVIAKETGEPIPFPAISIVRTAHGTLGDANGYFELKISAGHDSLAISALGYKTVVMPVSSLKKQVSLEAEAYKLSEITVKPGKELLLGTAKYSKGVCTGFAGENSNWRGEQAAIRAVNKTGKRFFPESFGFYVIKNDYPDSLQFRLMLYEVDSAGFPGKTFLNKPILFKIKTNQGEVRVDLTRYNLEWGRDFFISLECLEEKMEASKFCFAGDIKTPSYVKTGPFARWVRIRGGGGGFNVKAKEIAE